MGALRILIVEDDENDELLLLQELRRGGFDPVHTRVQDADAMKRALRDELWDLVVSDYRMPDFDALAALDVLSETGLDVPFVIVSGTMGEETAVAAMRAGARDFIVKGHLARLVPVVHRELEEARVRAESRRMHEQLLIADRMATVGTLAAGVAHEINNPLAAIVTNLELLSATIPRSAGAEQPGVVDALHDACEAAERVRAIVRDLRIFSHPTDEVLTPVDARTVLESTVRMAWNELRHRARLTTRWAPIPKVRANEARLSQVFLNLLVNAAQAIPEGDVANNSVVLATRADTGGRVAVSVSDTGVGIPDEHLRRIFDPFFTTKPVGIGTGLGLSICHRLVSAMGGEIRVRSRPGEGSTFEVVLLAAARESEPMTAASPADPSANPRTGRILVVDDDALVARTLQRRLSPPHSVVVVTSGLEALSVIEGGDRFDVILSDVMMPEMSGTDLYVGIARIDADQARRVVFVSGGAFSAGARAFLDQVDNARLEKPFDWVQLSRLIDERVSWAAGSSSEPSEPVEDAGRRRRRGR